MNVVLLRRRLLESRSGRLFLGLLSLFYGTAVLVRNLLYGLRLLPSRRLEARTVCIGNLTVGGTGKTSAVLLAAYTLHKRRKKVAIVSRGYGSRVKRGEVQVLLKRNVTWVEVGDEPWLMHRALKGLEIPILVSPDRYQAGLTALTYYTPEILLLDDGFQHRRLRRDLDIVLINALDPFGGGRLLPLGGLREPLRALRRAGLVVLTHTDQVPRERLAQIQDQVRGVRPDLPMAESVHRADFLLDLKLDLRYRLTYLKGKRVACVSAIGEPRPFEDQLRRLGAELVQAWRFPDHHPYTPEELRSIDNVRAGVPLVTTFKDLARLPPGWPQLLQGEVLALAVKLQITRGRELWDKALCDESEG